jgi:RND superfamily putative drug exporter
MASSRPRGSAPSRWLRIGIPALLVLIWVVGGSIGGPYFGKVDEVSTNDQSSFLPQSAAATRVNERLADFLGDDSIPAVVVFEGEAPIDDAQRTALQAVSDDIAGFDGVLVGGAASPPDLLGRARAAGIAVVMEVLLSRGGRQPAGGSPGSA